MTFTLPHDVSTLMAMPAAELPIGVVGAGAMGAGIAQVAAVHGHPVVLADAQAAALERARAGHVAAMTRDVEKGRRTREDADAVLARFTYVDGVTADALSHFAPCTMVIEAIVEQLAAKQTLFRALDAIVSPQAILASNTSSLSIAAIGSACTRAERVVGVHFFNPAPIMPLVEIISAISTAPEFATAALTLAHRWGKTTVRVTDTPGFLVNRVARPYYGESLRMLEEGIADVATIDWALTTIGGFRMGPFTLMDMIGNDVNFAVSCSVYEGTFHDPRYRPSVTQQRLVEAGWLGRKSGRGYYRYDAEAPAPAPVMNATLGQQIVDRVLAMLVNEAVTAHELGIASRPHIETAMTTGVNYPRGLLAWGDLIGAGEILHRLERLQARYGDPRYRPSPRIAEIIAGQGTLLNG
jgi:3-hydroxybutyryl-CoA dehydrogenase